MDGSLRDFYADPVVPTDRCLAEGGCCSAGVGRRIGDRGLAGFDRHLVWNGGLLFVRRSLPSQAQGFVVPPLLRHSKLRIGSLLLQGLQEASGGCDYRSCLAEVDEKHSMETLTPDDGERGVPPCPPRQNITRGRSSTGTETGVAHFFAIFEKVKP